MHLDTTTGTPDLSGSGPCGLSRCRINPAFRLTSLSLCVWRGQDALCGLWRPILFLTGCAQGIWLRSVIARFPRFLIVLALAGSIGLHWAFLQSVAWDGMVISYSEDAPLSEALAKTFDGRHPCFLFRASLPRLLPI